MRLIDADELKKALNHAIWRPDWEHIRDKVLQDIDEQPTVDAVEVVHGKWEFCEEHWSGDLTYKCSNCGDELDTLPGIEIDWDYCPNCGAKMDGKVE